MDTINAHLAMPQSDTAHLIDDPAFLSSLGLDRSDAQRADFFNALPHYTVQKIAKPYPSLDQFVVESRNAQTDWREHWDGTPFADSRYGAQKGKTRNEIEYTVLDKSRLNRIVARGESAIFLEEGTNRIILGVIRYFLPIQINDELQKRLIMLCLEENKARRNVRCDDAGTYTMPGYTPGARNNPTFGYSDPKSTRTHLNNPAQQLRQRAIFAGLSALVFNMIERTLPANVVNCFEEYMVGHNIPSLPWDPDCESIAGGYRVKMGHTVYETTIGKGTPASVGTAVNYAKSVHRDSDNASTYMVNLTVLHTAPPDTGGNFIQCDHGILVEAESNTLVFFEPTKHAHGTTFPQLIPRINTGLGFFVANRLDAALKHDAKLANKTPAYKNESMMLVEKKEDVTEEDKRTAALKELQDEARMQNFLKMDLGQMADHLVASGEYEIVSTNTRGEKWLGRDDKHKHTVKPKKIIEGDVLGSMDTVR